MTTAQAPTLTVLQDGTPIFTSDGKWLHPLFELEDYLAEHPIQPAQSPPPGQNHRESRGAADPSAGISDRQGWCLSRLGEAVLQRHGIAYTYEQLVDRIHCQTEELLATVEDPEEAYQLVKVRAGR